MTRDRDPFLAGVVQVQMIASTVWGSVKQGAGQGLAAQGKAAPECLELELGSIGGSLNRGLTPCLQSAQEAKRVFQSWNKVKGTDEARSFLLALLVDERVKKRS